MFSCLLALGPPGRALGEQICLCLYFEHSYIPPNDISLSIVWEVLKCCCSVWVSFRQDDISAGECLKSLDITEREQPFVLLVLLFMGAADSTLSPDSFRVSHLQGWEDYIQLLITCFRHVVTNPIQISQC